MDSRAALAAVMGALFGLIVGAAISAADPERAGRQQWWVVSALCALGVGIELGIVTEGNQLGDGRDGAIIPRESQFPRASRFAVDNDVHHLCKTVLVLCTYWGNDGDSIAEAPRSGPLELA